MGVQREQIDLIDEFLGNIWPIWSELRSKIGHLKSDQKDQEIEKLRAVYVSDWIQKNGHNLPENVQKEFVGISFLCKKLKNDEPIEIGEEYDGRFLAKADLCYVNLKSYLNDMKKEISGKQIIVTFIDSSFKRSFETDNLECWLGFSVIDSSLIRTPRERASVHRIKLVITEDVLDKWGINYYSSMSNVTENISKDMKQVAFQIVEDHISEQLKKGQLKEKKLPPLLKNTKNSNDSLPYNLKNILYPDKKTFTVEIEDDNLINQSLEKCLEDFAQYIKSEERMSFWRSEKGKGKKWVSKPEKHAKILLQTFLNGRFGNSIDTFEEIKSGAGYVDIFIITPNRESNY